MPLELHSVCVCFPLMNGARIQRAKHTLRLAPFLLICQEPRKQWNRLSIWIWAPLSLQCVHNCLLLFCYLCLLSVVINADRYLNSTHEEAVKPPLSAEFCIKDISERRWRPVWGSVEGYWMPDFVIWTLNHKKQMNHGMLDLKRKFRTQSSHFAGEETDGREGRFLSGNSKGSCIF